MRIPFWRSGKAAPVEQARIGPAASRPAAALRAAPAAAEFGELDMRAVGQALNRKRAWMIAPTLLALVISLAAVNLVSPRYKSEARILIDGRENVFLRPNGERDDQRNAVDPE